MNGIINFFKPPGMTSHDVVQRLRKELGIKKIGHTGTLDPQASGVLPICVGYATRLAEFISVSDKTYFCRLKLGIVTSTQDAWGDVLSQTPVKTVCYEDVEKALSSFRGCISQRVPAYSAVKLNGEPLYKKARRGEENIQIFREINIKDLQLIDIKGNELSLKISCSKGTYIRTLCHDLGSKLGLGAHMSYLLRIQAGSFHLKDSTTFEKVIKRKPGFLIKPSASTLDLPQICLDEEESTNIRFGRKIYIPNDRIQLLSTSKDLQNRAALIDQNNDIVAIAWMQSDPEAENTFLKPQKVFRPE